MTAAPGLRARARAATLQRSWRLPGYAVLAAIVAAWAWRAFHDPYGYDTKLAYDAGKLAWATGHPEHLQSWMSTTFLGAVMALLSRVASERAVADLVTASSVVLWTGAVAVALRRLRGTLAPAWWWIAAVALLAFPPLMSSVWFKQFNVIALVLALGGFDLVRRGRVPAGAAAIGVSVAVKPLATLLIPVMLARRGTRRAGALAAAWAVGLNVAAQGFMALRAQDLAALDPLIGLRNFLHKNGPGLGMCLTVNFSPTSMVCRMTGTLHDWTLQRLVVIAGVVVLGAWVVDALRGRGATSWEVPAFALPLSVMASPIAWTHYQILLAPLFLLLLCRFSHEGASAGAWAGLAAAFALSALIWQPYGSIATAVQDVFGSARAHDPVVLEGYAQLAQYVAVITGVLWYLGRREPRPPPTVDTTFTGHGARGIVPPHPRPRGLSA